jgi:hypothetical protein
MQQEKIKKIVDKSFNLHYFYLLGMGVKKPNEK